MLTKLIAGILGPWADVALALLVAGAWLYGDITGKGAERQKNQIETLQNEKKTLIEQRDAASEVQRQMARNVAVARGAQAEVEEKAGVLERELREEERKNRGKGSAGPCTVDERQRLRYERLWPRPATPAPGAR